MKCASKRGIVDNVLSATRYKNRTKTTQNSIPAGLPPSAPLISLASPERVFVENAFTEHKVPLWHVGDRDAPCQCNASRCPGPVQSGIPLVAFLEERHKLLWLWRWLRHKRFGRLIGGHVLRELTGPTTTDDLLLGGAVRDLELDLDGRLGRRGRVLGLAALAGRRRGAGPGPDVVVAIFGIVVGVHSEALVRAVLFGLAAPLLGGPLAELFDNGAAALDKVPAGGLVLGLLALGDAADAHGAQPVVALQVLEQAGDLVAVVMGAAALRVADGALGAGGPAVDGDKVCVGEGIDGDLFILVGLLECGKVYPLSLAECG
jgi:hypothetical protein